MSYEARKTCPIDVLPQMLEDFRPRLVEECRRILRQIPDAHEVAEDIFQDTACKIIEMVSEGLQIQKIYPWAKKEMTWRAISLLRCQKRRTELLEQNADTVKANSVSSCSLARDDSGWYWERLRRDTNLSLKERRILESEVARVGDEKQNTARISARTKRRNCSGLKSKLRESLNTFGQERKWCAEPSS